MTGELEPVITPAEREPWWKMRLPIGPLALAYLLILAIGVGGFALIARQQSQFEHEVARRDHERCLDSRDGRQVLRQLVELSDNGGGGFDLTQVPGFEDLDPATKAFFANIAAASSPTTEPGGTPAQSRFVKDALALLTIPTCPDVGEPTTTTTTIREGP